jgi:hypothetical protein
MLPPLRERCPSVDNPLLPFLSHCSFLGEGHAARRTGLTSQADRHQAERRPEHL